MQPHTVREVLAAAFQLDLLGMRHRRPPAGSGLKGRRRAAMVLRVTARAQFTMCDKLSLRKGLL